MADHIFEVRLYGIDDDLADEIINDLQAIAEDRVYPIEGASASTMFVTSI